MFGQICGLLNILFATGDIRGSALHACMMTLLVHEKAMLFPPGKVIYRCVYSTTGTTASTSHEISTCQPWIQLHNNYIYLTSQTYPAWQCFN
jgi:hypothetical protein